jgi:hypothetical protein
MRRTILAILAFSVVIGGAASAWAVVFDSTTYYVKRGYHRNVAWPWPYVCPDRMAVREPFAIMIENGWRRQNLLGEYHFNPQATGLTKAGELKVQWILTQAPPSHRTVFVERSVEPSVTASRVAAARDYATLISVDGPAPQVSETYIVSEGRPASIVDSINVRFQESAMPPVLPAATAIDTGQ